MQAAMVIQSLPPAQASQVLSRLDSRDIKAVIDAVSRLESPCREDLNASVQRLLNEAKLANRTHPENELSTLGNSTPVFGSSSINDANDTPFRFLIDTALELRCQVLRDEHPRNIAIALSFLPPRIASETMKEVGDWNLRISVLKRMCELTELDDLEVEPLSMSLKRRLNRVIQAREKASNGVGKAVKMLSCSDRLSREVTLERFEQIDPDLATTIKRSVVGFERLESLDDSEMLTLLRHVDTTHWAPALKNASTSLVARVMKPMASSVVAFLQREIDELGFSFHHRCPASTRGCAACAPPATEEPHRRHAFDRPVRPAWPFRPAIRAEP